MCFFCFCIATATTVIYTILQALTLHDAHPITYRTYGAFIGGKTRTILLPMLLWNLLALLIISGGAYAEFLKAPIPVSFQEAFKQLLCLTAPNETNVKMAFWRDMFV